MAQQNPSMDRPLPISAQFFLWSIREQDKITRCLTMNIWSAVAAMLAVTLAGILSLAMALKIILFGGMATGCLVWILIERRRSWLLHITDPTLKAVAHEAMIDYLARRLCPGPQCRNHLNDPGSGRLSRS